MTPEATTPAARTLPSLALALPTQSLGAPALVEATPQAAAEPGLILFGRDERGRPHASTFPAVDAEGATRAVTLMGLHTLTVGEEHRAIAAGFARGRLFASGKAFVPFCAAVAFARLLAAAGLPDMPVPLRAASKPAEAPPGAGLGLGGDGGADGGGKAAKRPATFDDIGIGSVVLACQGPMEGWWEAVVKFTKTPDSFVLSWRDFPSDPEFIRARKDLGLLPLDSLAGLR